MDRSVPEVAFGPWQPWGKLEDIRRNDGRWLGVYLWAHFKGEPPTDSPTPTALLEDVIYVGETKDLDVRPLSGRHHRLKHYRETFCCDPDLTKLHVAVWRVERFPKSHSGGVASERYRYLRVYTQFIEAQLYWQYTQQHGRPPKLHYKKDSKKPISPCSAD